MTTKVFIQFKETAVKRWKSASIVLKTIYSIYEVDQVIESSFIQQLVDQSLYGCLDDWKVIQIIQTNEKVTDSFKLYDVAPIQKEIRELKKQTREFEKQAKLERKKADVIRAQITCIKKQNDILIAKSGLTKEEADWAFKNQKDFECI